jgi:hypothetical protein
MDVTITILDADALIQAFQAVEAAQVDPQYASDALDRSAAVLGALTMRVTEQEADEPHAEQWMEWAR